MRARSLYLLTAALALGGVAAALVSQHRFGMQPCPWCILQRLVFVLIAAVALLGAAAPVALGRVLAAPVAALLGLGGMAAALWQHVVAANDVSCNLTWPDRLLAALRLDALLPEVFQPRASCAEAKALLWGLPYEFWSLGLFALLAVLAAAARKRA